MDNVNLPNGTAREPDEDAHETQCEDMSSQTPKRNITFAESIESSQKSSQCISAYKEALSQPPPTLTRRELLQWLQQRREGGLWAQCDSCARWRYLPHVLDSHELPAKWYCNMNPDKRYSNCSIAEAPLRVKDEEDLIHGEYSAGSVVWARLPGWPWWPAMVDDCPDTEQFYWLDGFSDIPTHYNVVFFDAIDCTRAWIAPEHLLPYEANKKMFTQKDKKYKKRLEAAQKQANDADALPLRNRLAKYSFIARYPGVINHPKQFNKKELRKFKNQLKRKYNMEFPDESESEEEANDVQMKEVKKQNVIILGTPKKPKQKNTITKTKANDKKIPKGNNKLQNILLGNVTTQKHADSQNTTDTQCNGYYEMDSITVINGESETTTNVDKVETDVNGIFIQPNSMVVQVGTVNSSIVEEPFDNDTSKTYVPDSEGDSENENGLQETISNIRKHVISPGSDYFEF